MYNAAMPCIQIIHIWPGLYLLSVHSRAAWKGSCWIRGTRAFIHQQRPDLVSKAHAMIMDMTLICRKAADDQVGQYIMHGGIAGYLVGVETSFHTTRTQTTPFGTRTGKDVAWTNSVTREFKKPECASPKSTKLMQLPCYTLSRQVASDFWWLSCSSS